MTVLNDIVELSEIAHLVRQHGQSPPEANVLDAELFRQLASFDSSGAPNTNTNTILFACIAHRALVVFQSRQSCQN